MSSDDQNIVLTRVNEPLSSYAHGLEQNIGNISFSDFFLNKMLIVKAIAKGIPFKIFAQIQKFTPFSDADWAAYLDISLKSLQRYREDDTHCFKSIHSEKIIELAEVTNFGIAVFGSSEKFYAWLQTPSYALGGLKPSELIKNSYGKEMVMAELNRIEHGIFA